MEIVPDVKALLDCLNEPAILLSPEYRILLANKAYEGVYGDGKPLRRRHCYEVSHRYDVPCDQAGEHCPLLHSLETGQPSRVLHVHHTPRGHEYVEVEMRPVLGPEGEIRYFVEIMRPSTIADAQARGGSLIGRSASFNRMLDRVNRVAPSDANVLLLGESGTGKELIAGTLHERSARAAGPFVPVECTGLPETLFESELFGYVRGAFTGANSDKLGLVESAGGGTLFLDEVGDIPLSAQVKLLRLLETRTFRRVGSTETRSTDFRLICATNKDLAALVDAGQFRDDLYFRLNVFEIELPPLRTRHDDMALLIDHLLQRLRPHQAPSVADETLRMLHGYRFPGNVRELRNIVEHALLMCDGDRLLPHHLPERVLGQAQPWLAGGEDDDTILSLAEVERRYLPVAMARHAGDRKSLARKLGLSERALYRRLAALKPDGAD